MAGKITKKDLGNGAYRLEIEKMVDENLPFPTDLPGLKSLSFDVGNVTFINSAGIRNWVRWFQFVLTLGDVKIEFHRVPLAVIKTAQGVPAVLPATAEIHSFYYDAVCDDCNEETNELIHNRPGAQLPQMKCAKCGKPMEGQLPESAYRRLLKS